MKLSNQAIGAVMMALQKSLMEQTDIVPVLQNFQLEKTDNEGEHLMRVPQIPTIRPPSSDGDSKTGRLTQEKIEENQQLLKEMKKEARNQTYDD